MTLCSAGNRLWRTIAAAFLATGWLVGQDAGKQDALPGVDFTGLTAAQKTTALKLVREQGCSCGCGMKVAECRVKDPSCTYSRGLAATMIDALKKGESEQDAIAAAAKSQFAQPPPGQSNKLLEDPVKIPVNGAPVLGPANAPITLIEFSDFQCPYCVAATPQLQALVKTYPTQVKLIFKQYPLDIHSQASFAAAAALAAHKQGKFWPMHDALFANHDDLSDQNVTALAKRIGLDMQRFERDLHSTTIEQTIEQDIADGDRAGVEGTPTLFIDGQRFNGPLVMQILKPLVGEQLKLLQGAKTTAALHVNR
jgi:protein-disulfide isomerase